MQPDPLPRPGMLIEKLTLRTSSVDAIGAGEHFVAAGRPMPAWYGGRYECAPVDVVIDLALDGTIRVRGSYGAAEHH